MPTQSCPNEPAGSQIIAQTLFLGASVNSFNVSMGWGGQPSQLTVTLVDDFGCAGKIPYPNMDDYGDDHYHDCVGDSCYVNNKGETFNRSTMDISERMVPGKVYYFFRPNTTKCFVSRYWSKNDPGFLAKPNFLDLNATETENLNAGYDIIDTPVLFKMGKFTFGGLVQSWNEQIGQGGKIYTVTINSMQSLLNSCWVILSNYAGAVYSKRTNSTLYGGPRNWTGPNVDYFGQLSDGNIPNVFNVYGFLESFGKDSLGGSKSNIQGIRANDVIDALSVLTSNTVTGVDSLNRARDGYGAKSAFSPFGRILAKCMQENNTYNPITSNFNKFGVIPPNPVIQDGANSNRCQFVLDLSELPRFPNDFRINGPVMTITDLLNTLGEAAGFDYYTDLIPVYDTNYFHVIKVKTISRLAQPRPYQIENTIKQFQCNNYAISSVTLGKEKNDTSARSIIIGGPIQRLYQAKSLRLAYTQSNYIFDPNNKQFINYMQLGTINDSSFLPISGRQFHHGKVRTPQALDNNNPALSGINPSYALIYDHNDQLKKDIQTIKYAFTDNDPDWNDNQELSNSTTAYIPYAGNYGKTSILKCEDSTSATWGLGSSQRFFPLFKDVICPFFGFVLEDELSINTDNTNNDFRRVRPVWFDTWTGQIVVLLRVPELPATSVNLENSYAISGIQYFLITESEMRAALSGFDEFVIYHLSKTYKNDLIEMLRRAYIAKDTDIYKTNGIEAELAAVLANKKHSWYWRLINNGDYTFNSNVAGPFTQTISPIPAKTDGTHNIPQEVLNDLKILHSFVASLSQHYGKQYMVVAPYLAGYKDYSYSQTLNTSIGDAYVFSGGGDIRYSYQPTNDGAWEEYGNTIDDCMVVGGKEWLSLTDDAGKIQPILGYNANDSIDKVKVDMCKLSTIDFDKFAKDRLNPFWSFAAWETIKDKMSNTCDGKFTFPSLDYSSLNAGDYILVTPSGNATDPFGKSTGLKPKKLFTTTTVKESFIFLDPEHLKEPRFLVDAPGLYLNNSSDSYISDPNKSILSTVAMEDLAIYLKITNPGARDNNWINSMLSYIYTIASIGNYASSANKSANYATLHPKAAHPFFVGVPIKSNIYNYGPWTNYPYLEYLADPQKVFPDGIQISGANCTNVDVKVSPAQAKQAINNWILPTTVDIVDDYVPWNFGGMAFLDNVAFSDARNRTNYQNVLETAQIDMPGLPLFNLGGSFIYGDFASEPIDIDYTNINLYDVKFNPNNPLTSIPNLGLPILYAPFIPTDTSITFKYKILKIISASNSTGGPVITNIQTNVSQAGILTTYSFRTYTKKIGLFNKENSDTIKRINLNNLRRNKQLAKINTTSVNNFDKQIKLLQKQKLEGGGISSKDFKSKLFGWSPVKVLIGQSSPYLTLSKDTQIDGIYFSSTGILGTRSDPGQQFSLKYGTDVGDDSYTYNNYLTDDVVLPTMSAAMRFRTDVGLFEDKEVNAQLENDYALQSVMSLDGIFSPVSFYPTFKNSTFNMGLYDQNLCPFCNGTKKINIRATKYIQGANISDISYTKYCDKCTTKENLLNFKLKSSATSSNAGQSLETLPPYIVTSGTDIVALANYMSNITTSSVSSSTSSSSNSSGKAGVSIPINLVSLQPIVVPYGEFKNPNTQNYSGVHPDGDDVHASLTIGSNNRVRTFYDRCRHSIEVVGRGSINPKNMNIANGLRDYEQDINNNNRLVNADYYYDDIRLSAMIKDRTGTIARYQNNQRFIGLRGPLILHGWGYDLEGYPVPNAADEPLEIDTNGRYKRFKLKIKDNYPKDTTYKDVEKGSLYIYNGQEYIKGDIIIPNNIQDSTSVQEYIYEDDLTDQGGFDEGDSSRTTGYKGNIIGKTQKFQDGKWTEKKKLKEFYLNWAERPDLWPVGPVDFRWDNDRKVWATKSSDVSSIYKMVYVTLEEDLVKDEDTDDTYPARGFLDDLEYSTQPLSVNLRRLVFVKDRSGYTAPRGAKLLCRYDKDSGFYEPVGKASFVAKGSILAGTNTAIIEMSYIAGKKRGEPYPTMMVNFENLFDLPITQNKGLFTFLNSRWVLTTSK